MTVEFPENRKIVSDRMKSDVKSQLPQSNPYLRNSFLQALIFGFAGRIFAAYKLVSNVMKVLFWDTTFGTYLTRWAAIFGINQNAATGSSGYVTAVGTVGTSIPIGTELQSSGGIVFETKTNEIIQAEIQTITITQTGGTATATTASSHKYAGNISVTISGADQTGYNGAKTITNVISDTQFQFSVDPATVSPATGTISCTADIASLEVESQTQGDDTNIDAGDALTFSSPIAGVNDTAYTQYEGLQGGTDIEETENLRSRFLYRVQNPVALFNEAAITTEARKINGVTRVFVSGVDLTQGALALSSITSAGGVAIADTGGPDHGIETGQRVTISGCNEAGYNVSSYLALRISASKFAFLTIGTPASPATGSPSVASSVVDPGQVKVYFTRDNDDSPIPSTVEIDAVKAQILTIKPGHMSDSDVVVRAPTAKTTNYALSSISPDTPSMRTAIENNLKAFYQEETDIATAIPEAQYNNAIYNTVDPDTGTKLQSFVLSSPSGAITADKEELPILGSISF